MSKEKIETNHLAGGLTIKTVLPPGADVEELTAKTPEFASEKDVYRESSRSRTRSKNLKNYNSLKAYVVLVIF